MGLLATAASLAMAFGAPLVYLDQALSIARQRDSSGFSSDIPALLIIANLTRCFFWLGERFEFALLLQSVLMIISQIYLQRLILKFSEESLSNYRFTSSSDDRNNPSRRNRRDVLFDQEQSNRNDQGNGTGRFNGRENLPTFDIVVEPPSPTSSNSNPNGGETSSKKSSKDSKGRYSSLKTSHSDDPTNVSNSNRNQDEGEIENQDDEQDLEPRNLLSKIKAISSKIFKNFTTFSGQGVFQMKDGRPFNFWRWKDFSSYLIFILFFILLQTLLYLLLGSFPVYISILGYLSLGLESTLPIPQLIANQKRKSLSGFSLLVLLGWVVGDSFKLIYFIVRDSPIQFITCSCFQLSIDLLICAQLWFFREKTRLENEERQKVAQVLESESGRGNNGQEDWVEPTTTRSSTRKAGRSGRSNLKSGNGDGDGIGRLDESDPFVLAAEEEDEDEDDAGDWARNAWSKAGTSSNHGVGEVEADESEEEGKGKEKARK